VIPYCGAGLDRVWLSVQPLRAMLVALYGPVVCD